MKYPTPQNETELDRVYFYNLIQNPNALPPQGLDALTAEIIRRLVLGEQLAEVKSPYQLEPAKNRVWHSVLVETNQPTSAWPPVDPALTPTGRYAPLGRPEPQRLYGRTGQPIRRRAVFNWNPLIVLACIAGAALLAGLAFQVMFAASYPTNEVSEAMPLPGGERIIISEKQPPPISIVPTAPAPKPVNGKSIPVINLKELIDPAIDDLAIVVNVDPPELQAQLETGLSFMGLAKSLNIDPDLIRKALIESFTRQLHEGLAAGNYSSAQVAQALNATPEFVDQLINSGKY